MIPTLLLTQIMPYPPDAGPKVKTYNVLRYLAQRHEVHLASFVRSADDLAAARSLEGLCASVTTVPLHRSIAKDIGYLGRSLLSGRPFLIERDDLLAMRRAIEDLLSRHDFDAVHADQLSMAQYAVDLSVPLRVLDAHNAVWTIVRRSAGHESWGPRRLLMELEWRRLRAYEGKVCKGFTRVTVVSEEDRKALESAAGAPLPAEVIPIAVDTTTLEYAPRSPEAKHIVSVATMFYPPNVEGVHWFAQEVFPLVRRALPEVYFYVVGARPPAKITRLARPETNIAVTGYVADLEPILRESAVMVVPVHSGSGMRVKILEAFARGIPVVSTTVGVEGIDATPGTHLLVADSPQDFAQALVRLLNDRSEAVRLASAARQLVEARYDWRRALSGLDRVYGGVVTPQEFPGSVQAS